MTVSKKGQRWMAGCHASLFHYCVLRRANVITHSLQSAAAEKSVRARSDWWEKDRRIKSPMLVYFRFGVCVFVCTDRYRVSFLRNGSQKKSARQNYCGENFPAERRLFVSTMRGGLQEKSAPWKIDVAGWGSWLKGILYVDVRREEPFKSTPNKFACGVPWQRERRWECT